MTSRRAFLATLAGGLLLAPLAGEAQPAGKVFHVGFLTPGAVADSRHALLLDALRAGLRGLGYVEGRNLILERRYAETHPERLPELATNLARTQTDLIIAVGSQASHAAQQATATLPIVMIGVGDPVAVGLVASLARPGANVTGLTISTGPEIYSKHLELLKEIVPKLTRIAVVIDPRSPYDVMNRRELDSAAHALGLTLQIHEVRSAADVERAFATMPGQRAGAVFAVPNPFIYSQRRHILELATRQHLPGAYGFREFIEDGGLVYYGTDLPAMWRHAAVYVDKILKGAKPADLPVEQPTKFELVINLKTAKARGLTIPESVLMRADQIIQ